MKNKETQTTNPHPNKFVPINSIKKNPANPRIIKDSKFASLVNSIKEFPEMLLIRPIVINEDSIILGGNMRYEAARAAGMESIPVIQVKLSKEQEREFVIKDNAAYGDWDWDMLSNEFDVSQLNDWGVDVPDWANINPTEVGIELPNGEKPPFRQFTFTLTNEQADKMDDAIQQAKHYVSDEYSIASGNPNSNGNAISVIISEYLSRAKENV